MKQPDFAERQVQQLLNDATMLPHDNKGIWCCIKRVELVRLLRAERARAVRVLQRHKLNLGSEVWNNMIDDAIAAIKGKP